MTVPSSNLFNAPQTRSSTGVMRRPGFRKWLIGAVVLLLAGGFAYWHYSGEARRPRPSPAPVRTAKVERRDMSVIQHTLGTVIANSMVQITARVQGTLEAATFREGQFVKKGDMLFRIDPRPFQAALAAAQAVLSRDEALLRNAQRDKARYESLQAQGASSQQQRDTSATNADVLTATVAADKAALETAKLNVGYTQIQAPVSGKTGAVLVQPGNMVSAGGSTILSTLAEIQPVKVSFNLPQAALPAIQAREKTAPLVVTLDVNGADGKPLSAPVVFTANAVNNLSGTVELRATFPNSDYTLLPGQTVNVTVETDRIPNALVVPRDAVNDGPNGAYVYAVVDGRAEERSVKVLFDDATFIALTGDVKEGDAVVTEGQLRVNPGAPVNVMGPAGSKSPEGAGRRGGRRRKPPQ